MKRFKVKVNSKEYIVEVEELTENEGLSSKPKAQELNKDLKKEVEKDDSGLTEKTSPSIGNSVNAPMAGNIIKIKCVAGDLVKKGQVLLILEAMKMENEIVAPRDGKIKNIHVSQGITVKNKQPLLEIEG